MSKVGFEVCFVAQLPPVSAQRASHLLPWSMTGRNRLQLHPRHWCPDGCLGANDSKALHPSQQLQHKSMCPSILLLTRSHENATAGNIMLWNGSDPWAWTAYSGCRAESWWHFWNPLHSSCVSWNTWLWICSNIWGINKEDRRILLTHWFMIGCFILKKKKEEEEQEEVGGSWLVQTEECDSSTCCCQKVEQSAPERERTGNL